MSPLHRHDTLQSHPHAHHSAQPSEVPAGPSFSAASNQEVGLSNHNEHDQRPILPPVSPPPPSNDRPSSPSLSTSTGPHPSPPPPTDHHHQKRAVTDARAPSNTFDIKGIREGMILIDRGDGVQVEVKMEDSRSGLAARGNGQSQGEDGDGNGLDESNEMEKRQWHSSWSLALPQLVSTTTFGQTSTVAAVKTTSAAASSSKAPETTAAVASSVASSSADVAADTTETFPGAPTTFKLSSVITALATPTTESPTQSSTSISVISTSESATTEASPISTSLSPSTTVSPSSLSSLAIASSMTSPASSNVGTSVTASPMSTSSNATAAAASTSAVPLAVGNATAPIIGAVVGIFVGGLIILATIGLCYRRWSRKHNQNPFADEKITRNSSFGGGGGGGVMLNIDDGALASNGGGTAAGWKEKYTGTPDGQRVTTYSASNGGMAGIGSRRDRGDAQDPYAEDRRMIQHGQGGHSRDLTAGYGTRSPELGYTNERDSPTDYFGRSLAHNDVEMAEEYADYPAAAAAYSDESLGAATNASSSIGIAGAHSTAPTQASVNTPQLPPFSPGMLTPPATSAAQRGAPANDMRAPRAAYAEYDDDPRNSYAELARVAQVDEPVTPGPGNLSRDVSAGSMASARKGNNVQRYQHGRPLSPLKELDSPVGTASISHYDRNPFDIGAYKRESFESTVLPSNESSPPRAPPGAQRTRYWGSPTGGEQDPSHNRNPSIEFPPPTPDVSLPESPASFLVETPKSHSLQQGGPHRILSGISSDSGSYAPRVISGNWRGVNDKMTSGGTGPSPMGRAVYFNDPYGRV